MRRQFDATWGVWGAAVILAVEAATGWSEEPFVSRPLPKLDIPAATPQVPVPEGFAQTPAPLPAQANAPIRIRSRFEETPPQPDSPATPPPKPAETASRRPMPGGFGTPRPSTESIERQEKYVKKREDAELLLDLQVGRPALLEFTKTPFRVQLADPDIADYIDITETEFSITGNVEGTTVLTFWFQSGDQPGEVETLRYLVRVFPDPEANRRLEARMEALEHEINRAFPNSAVRLTYVGNQVVIRGQAKDVEEATQIVRIVSANIPGAGAANAAPFDPNLLRDGQLPYGTAQAAAGTAIATSLNPLSNVTPSDLVDAGGLEGLLTGQTNTGVNAARINANVINLLEIAGVHQVMLKVTVAEVNRSAARAIGADLSIGDGDPAGFFSLLPLANLGVPGAGGTFLVNEGDFQLALNALKTLNMARSLAEPNLIALNGQQAQFQVGGNFPVPVVTGATATGLQGVQFVPFGVQLQFLPFVTDHDRIRLRLQATVSTRDESIGTNVGAGAGGGGGTAVAGLNTRNFNTTVELRDGQTLAIGGLVQTNFGGTSNRVPFAGDVPFLGRLFSSDSNSYDEQELVVLVTPYLVSPVEKGVQLPLPGSDMFEPSDFEFYVRGNMTGCHAEDYRSPARTDIHKMKAFYKCEQQVIIGQPGHSLRGW